MSLYSGTLQEFIDETCDEIVGKMLGKFPDHSFKEEPDEKEVNSWKTSIPILKLIFSSYLKKEEREISKIFLEYEMPLLSYQRADCIITVGKRIVVLEFKNYPSKNKLMVEKDLLICDETQNATDKEIETIIKNEKIKKIIFFFGENQFTNRGFPEELNNLKKLNKLSISELKLEKSYRFGDSENNHLEKVESFLSDNGKRFEDNSDYVKVYCDIGDMIKKLNELKNENSIRTLASYSHENSKFPFSIDGKEGKYSFVYHKNAASDNEDPRITAYKFSYNDNESFSREVNGTTEYYLGMPSTVLGFEYDYVGIIWGKDLYYDSEKKEWSYDENFIKDPELKELIDLESKELLKILKNRYRVLLTRARKGCYIYFEHEGTKNHFKEIFGIE